MPSGGFLLLGLLDHRVEAWNFVRYCQLPPLRFTPFCITPAMYDSSDLSPHSLVNRVFVKILSFASLRGAIPYLRVILCIYFIISKIGHSFFLNVNLCDFLISVHFYIRFLVFLFFSFLRVINSEGYPFCLCGKYFLPVCNLSIFLMAFFSCKKFSSKFL